MPHNFFQKYLRFLQVAVTTYIHGRTDAPYKLICIGRTQAECVGASLARSNKCVECWFVGKAPEQTAVKSNFDNFENLLTLIWCLSCFLMENLFCWAIFAVSQQGSSNGTKIKILLKTFIQIHLNNRCINKQIREMLRN